VAPDQNNSKQGHKFWSDRWIALKVLQLFPKAVFFVVPMESLLVEEEVLSRQTGITTQKHHNFLSNRWIALNVLHEFQEAPFLVLPIESLLVKEEVL